MSSAPARAASTAVSGPRCAARTPASTRSLETPFLTGSSSLRLRQGASKVRARKEIRRNPFEGDTHHKNPHPGESFCANEKLQAASSPVFPRGNRGFSVVLCGSPCLLASFQAAAPVARRSLSRGAPRAATNTQQLRGAKKAVKELIQSKNCNPILVSMSCGAPSVWSTSEHP